MDREFQCKVCGEWMSGDGYTYVFHCPNADEETYRYHEPDATPVCCEMREENDNT
ncbi:MAG: hypothetical protein M0R32_09520 [Candidatus Cloacimonetes bacterium]|jgi:hypothetical protein|nr:hypothetical protein [Candidatus Cloacimonadota bacterium]